MPFFFLVQEKYDFILCFVRAIILGNRIKDLIIDNKYFFFISSLFVIYRNCMFNEIEKLFKKLKAFQPYICISTLYKSNVQRNYDSLYLIISLSQIAMKYLCIRQDCCKCTLIWRTMIQY